MRASRWAVAMLAMLGVSLAVAISRPQQSAELNRAGSTVLAAMQAPQPGDVRVTHKDGQTFITWTESPEFALQGQPSADSVMQRRQELGRRVQYRVYRSNKLIESVRGLSPVGVALPLSGWNADFFGLAPAPTSTAFRYRISDDGPQLADNLGLYVHNPASAGRGYYAVTAVTDGTENPALGDSNRTQIGLDETVGPGVPVLQRVEQPQSFYYVEGRPQLNFYTRWEAPPRANIENRPIDYLVAVPPNVKNPAPVGIHLHGYGGSLTRDYGWWFNGDQGAILVATNQVPYDWWTGYHERRSVTPLESAADWQSGVVHPFTQTRLLAFVHWLATTRPVDLSRTFAAGISMGGSGALMLAIRYPDQVAWAASWVGIHRPHMSPTFTRSYEQSYGPANYGVKYEDGTPVWEFFDDVIYLRRHRARGIGFLTFSNGKNDNDIGWQQAVDFFRALQDTRQPHMFVWGQQGHGQRSAMPAGADERTMPLDLRTDRSLPAFTRSSLDDDPGDGSLAKGAASGQSNLYIVWEPGTIQDLKDSWEVTVTVRKGAPAELARVDITPRRCQQFKPAPGERITWRNMRGGRVAQTGQVTVDGDGLVTLPEVLVSVEGNRIMLTRTGGGS